MIDPVTNYDDKILAPTRHVEDCAGDVGCLVRHQPDNGVGDFIRGADAPHRHRWTESVVAVRITAAGVNLGVDQPWPDRGDADAFGGDLVSEPDGEGIDRAFRSR